MIVGSESVGSMLYQQQVGRDNQMQRSQESSEEAAEQSNPRQMAADEASFSEESREMARSAAVTPANQAPETTTDMQMSQSQQQTANQGTVMPGKILDVVA